MFIVENRISKSEDPLSNEDMNRNEGHGFHERRSLGKKGDGKWKLLTEV